MDEKNILTVLIMTYNHRSFLKDCIESVVVQKTTFDFKIHIFDDASIDGTTEIVREYAQKYPKKIIPFIQKQNIGSVANVLYSLKSVDTKYYATLDGDDFWCDEYKLQKQIDILEKNADCSFCTHNTRFHCLDDKKQHNKVFYKTPSRKIIFPIKNFNKKRDFIKAHPSSRIYRSSCLNIDKLKNKEIVAWDSTSYWWFLSQGNMYYLDEVMSVYNYSKQGIFSGVGKKQQKRMMIKALYAINKEFSYKYNWIFSTLIKRVLKLNIIDYLKLRFLIAKENLENVYNVIEKKYLKD